MAKRFRKRKPTSRVTITDPLVLQHIADVQLTYGAATAAGTANRMIVERALMVRFFGKEIDPRVQALMPVLNEPRSPGRPAKEKVEIAAPENKQKS